MQATKFTIETPLNQRCHDDTQRQAARNLILSGFRGIVSRFAMQCFERDFSKHHADGRPIPDWRESAATNFPRPQRRQKPSGTNARPVSRATTLTGGESFTP